MIRFVIAVLLVALLSLTTFALSAPTVLVKPDTIEDPDVLHTISWSGVESPNVGDALVIYLVPGSTTIFPIPEGPSKKAIGFYFAREHDLDQVGAGTVQVPVYLTRDMAFYYEFTRIEKKTSTVLAFSGLLKQTSRYTATHFHLATTHKDNEMLIQYVTSDLDHVTQAIQISTNDKFNDGIFVNATDTMLHYSQKDMFESPATDDAFWVDPGRFREALVTNLKPNVKYWYRVVTVDTTNSGFNRLLGQMGQFGHEMDFVELMKSNSLRIISKTFSFVSAPIVGAADSDTDLFIFGDLGVGFPFYTTVQQQSPSIKTTTSIFTQLAERANENDGKRTHSSLLLIGDLSYARGYHWMWEFWFKQIEPLAAQMPFHVSIGNHEYDYLKQKWKPDWTDFRQDSGGEGGVPTFRRFKCPDDWHVTPYTEKSWFSDENTKDYINRKERSIAYSYNTGQVHIIVCSAEHDFTKGSSQYQFIERDLQAIDRNITPWVIVTAHRPMYCSSMGCSVSPNVENKLMDWRLRQELEPLLIKYRVHLYIAGHNHHYARSSPITGQYATHKDQSAISIKDGVMTVKYRGAPIHVLTGASGNPYEPMYIGYEPLVANFIPTLHHETPEWLEFRTMSFGYSHIFANKTHLIHTFYGNQRTGLIHDRFVMVEP